MKRISEFWSSVLLSLLFTGLFLHNYLFNLVNPIDFSHFDTWHMLFTLNHYMEILETGGFSDLLNTRIFYGFDKTLLYSEFLFTQALIAIPFYFLSGKILFAYNSTAVVIIFLNFLSMFVFVKFLTKRTLPSILAAIIFTFNPRVMGHFPDQLVHYTLYPIPMILLFFEKSLQKPTNRNLFLVFFFATIQLLSNLSYSGILTIILPIYGVVRVWQSKFNIRKTVNYGAVAGLIFFLSVTAVLGLTYSTFYSREGSGRTSLSSTALYSPWISDLFLMNENNLLYGNFRVIGNSIIPNFVLLPSETVERNLFWGITPILIFGLSFKYLKRSEFKGIWFISLGLIVASLLLSFGPEIRFSMNFSIPGIYPLVYELHPLIHQLRVASRFAIFIYLFLALICAFTFKEILDRHKQKKYFYAGVFFICLLCLEYMNKPWIFTEFTPEIKNLYSYLDSQADVKVLLEMPMGNLESNPSLASNQFVDAKYMLYASALHSKSLINGYSSYTPPEYSRRIGYLSLNFPTQSKLEKLKDWGVDAIILHKDEYLHPEDYETIKLRLTSLGVPARFSTESISLFSLVDYSSTKKP